MTEGEMNARSLADLGCCGRSIGRQCDDEPNQLCAYYQGFAAGYDFKEDMARGIDDDGIREFERHKHIRRAKGE